MRGFAALSTASSQLARVIRPAHRHRSPAADDLHGQHTPHGGTIALTVGALGVVYGDIGTSPLYAVGEIFFGHGSVRPTPENVRGCVSLVVWALTLVVTVKYVLLVLRADNDGEGGVFALYGLLHRHRRFTAALSMLMLAAGLLFADGILTPAISVLSAVEGLGVATPLFARMSVPITVALLSALFAIQHRGTARVGGIFGPILICWFVAITALGGRELLRHPASFSALNPVEGLRFLGRAGLFGSLLALGSVMLAVTGCEALYADMGHFGAQPIRRGWFALVYPALMVNYLGQGAFLINEGRVVGGKLFYSLVPRVMLYPMVVLATAATVIASQALISGAYSITSQAIALGLFPRLRTVHTHHAHAGQIYLPFVNWALYGGCILLVSIFGSSSALASAYGLSVSGVMLATSLAMIAAAPMLWKWSHVASALVFGALAVIDAAFLASNSLKFIQGGFIPLCVGFALFGIMMTWRWGRKATFAAYSAKHTMKMSELIAHKRRATVFLERNALLMVPKPLRSEHDNTPALLQLLWDRYAMVPRNLIFVEVVHRKVPYIHDERYHVTVFQRDPGQGCIVSVTLSFGFMEEPNVERILEQLARHHQIALPIDERRWIVHVSIENILPGRNMNFLRRMRMRLFMILRHVSQPAHYYYGLGDEHQLSAEILPVHVR
jgi:KUP system potassium uptake protein